MGDDSDETSVGTAISVCVRFDEKASSGGCEGDKDGGGK
jgi:hypothetical protein